MAAECSKRRKAQRGVSLFELMMVVCVTLIVAALASPGIMRAVYNLRLRASAGDLSGLMQQARILAARKNTSYPVRYGTLSGTQIAYIDLNVNGSYDSGEPLVEFISTVVPAAGAPSGSGSQPSPYVLTGDTSSGAVFTNTSILGYSPRGLPCMWDTSTNPATCSTPTTNYFVYYLTDTRMGPPGWAGVLVTKAGRTKVVMWDGTTWH